VAVIGAPLACDRPVRGERAAASEERVPLVAPYAPAAWRFAPVAELDRSMLWLSHILIRHAQGNNTRVSFSAVDWRSVAPPPTRTRLEALQRANELALELANDPSQFAERALRVSEDVTTRERGGSLGSIVASHLWDYPQVLDALAVLPPEAVSMPIETEYGFHVFQRHAAPAAEMVSGAHIVIAHDDAPWFRMHARGALPKRSREQALALAAQVRAEASAHPERFEQLVAQWSEHRDAARGGDFGSWSTLEPTPFGRETTLLSTLAVGEVAAPIDTRFGIQILMRTPDRPRAEYAMKAIRVQFDPDAPPGSEASEDAARKEIEKVAREIDASPERFFETVRQLGGGVEQWQDGRGNAAVQAELDRLAIGEVSRRPARAEYGFVLAQRVMPAAAPQATYELPSPPERELPPMLASMRASDALSLLSSAANRVAKPDTTEAINRAHAAWVARVGAAETYPARVEAFFALQLAMRSVLGERSYLPYLRDLHRDLKDLVSATASDAPKEHSG